jgi:carotenoid cleavage dioxygenase
VAEDDGYLVSFVTDMQQEKTEIQVFDARGTSIGNGPVARIPLPRRVPHGFHGTWVSAKRMAGAPRATNG